MMGLFGSRKKTNVGTSVSRVIEDNQLPNSIITGGMKAQLMSDGQMIEHAMEELAGGLGLRVHSMHRYGKDHYINGLPSGTSMNNLQGRDTIKKAIEAELGGSVNLGYYKVGPINLLHLGWRMLVQDHGYDSSTNIFSHNDKDVYLTNMQPVVTDASLDEMENGSLDQWGVLPTAGENPDKKTGMIGGLVQPTFVVDPSAPADYIRVQFCWEEKKTVLVENVPIERTEVKKGEMTLAISGFDMEADYFQAQYTRNGKNGYWLYKMNSGVNAAVEEVFATAPKPTGTFFPMAYFRYGKKNMALVKDDEFKSQKKLLKYINMNFEDVAEAINENPDIADVEQAMFTMAVPARTDNPIEQRYLFDFFSNLWLAADQQGATSSSQTDFDIAGRLGVSKPASTIVIQDKKFKMALSWATIIKRRVAGKIGEIGFNDNAVNFKSETKKAETIDGLPMGWTTNVPVHAYRRQITENIYEEILVRNLKMTYHVFGQYTTTGDEKNDSILLIPLDFAITKDYVVTDREVLYARSMHFVFNSVVVTKLKWYQTGIFKVVLIIVAVVVTILSYGSTWQSIAAAFAVGGVAAAAMIIIPMLIKYLIVSFLVRKFVQAVGGKIALILATVAAIAGMYQVMTNGGLANAPWAKELLQVSSSLSNGAGQQFKRDFKELQGDFQSFQEFVQEKTDKLDAVNALLDGNMHLVPTVIFGESPDDFYQRTVHSGNIGMLGIEAVSSYVDAALTLPKLSDSLGEIV